jgi:type II secretory pathway pseudopilin PulG
MLASVILAILALAGAAFIYRSRADIALQKTRRVAVELANARLEELMYDWTFAQVSAQIGTPLSESVSINGFPGYQRLTTVSQTGTEHDECLQIIVQVEYRQPPRQETVRFETLRGR